MDGLNWTVSGKQFLFICLKNSELLMKTEEILFMNGERARQAAPIPLDIF